MKTFQFLRCIAHACLKAKAATSVLHPSGGSTLSEVVSDVLAVVNYPVSRFDLLVSASIRGTAGQPTPSDSCRCTTVLSQCHSFSHRSFVHQDTSVIKTNTLIASPSFVVARGILTLVLVHVMSF